MLRTAGIPMWVTAFALLVCVLSSVLGLMAMFGPRMEGMDSTMSVSWGGRSLGLGLAAGIAVLLKNPAAYIAAFVGGLGRDLGDLIAELGKSEVDIGIVVGIVVFFIVGFLGIMVANNALVKGDGGIKA